MAVQRDVLVIGGGVIGLTTAYFLARDGVQVTIIDQGELGREASWAGAGIIPPGNFDRAQTALDHLRALSAAMFGPLSAELRERTGIDNGYRLCGGVELASGIDEAILQAWQREAIPFEPIPAAELSHVEPAFSAVCEDGYYLPGMAQVRNPRHLKAFIAALKSFGVEMLPNLPVLRLQPNRSGIIQAVETPTGPLAAQRFLLTAGAWTARLLEPLGRRCDITPIRGQIVMFLAAEPIFKTILLRGKHYLVPRDDGRVLAGSTEENAGFIKVNTDAAIAELTAFARRFVKVLEQAPVESTWAGLRPGSADGLPTLGRHPDFDNLFLAGGHFRAGIQLSPATGRVMSELLQGRPTSVPLADFRLDRPHGIRQKTRFHS